jgi:hypothetical protein
MSANYIGPVSRVNIGRFDVTCYPHDVWAGSQAKPAVFCFGGVAEVDLMDTRADIVHEIPNAVL